MAGSDSMILFIDMKGKLPKLERRLLARSGQGANFRFGQEHRTFLSVNEFHYLTRSSLSGSCQSVTTMMFTVGF
jgi:hypothetical protein